MWYIGIANVTTNSVEVIGDANVDFVNNVEPGDAFICTGNGLTLEVLRAESRNKLILARPYTGPTGSFAFSVQPTQDFNRVTANAIIDLRNTYGGYRDTILQGAFPDGTVAAPGMRFIADQDTGVARYGPNLLSIVSGGVERMRFGEVNSSLAPLVASGGVTCQQSGVAGSLVLPLDIVGALGGAATMRIRFGSAANQFQYHSFIEAQTLTGVASDLRFGTSGVEQARIDNAGNFLVGVASGARHTIARASSEGDDILYVRNTAGQVSAVFQAVGAGGWQGPAALLLGKNSVNGRSAGVAGTVNAGGADYAEYDTKADGCGTIAAGDVCGVDREGLLTDRWADAIVFRIKSTNPSIVGGDTWAAHLGPRPEAPGAEPTAPAEPGSAPVAPVEPGPEPTEEGPAYVDWLQARFSYAAQLGEYEAALASWQAATIAYPAARAQFEADRAAWAAATAAYARDLPIYEAALEAERQKVDRIAYCGKVPVNMTDPVEVSDYLIAAQDGERIKAVAVKEADMTLALYMKRLGRVLFIRDGRPWVDVQHG
ncbi:hypothetical protein [Sphingomonas paucimobilis]|uniref:Uncharacterized protein n=1 Tax=Sphingomonas paucimobilis TaxID=13689 RepID=A0A7T3ABM7_SPHPI|nr:hypothetical protein [Sphingomonas paucimobilis]QPT09721.1 hypothetical protein I6G38_05550 [Sphingomonas paucimobilis]